jgi:hypothetical protein
VREVEPLDIVETIREGLLVLEPDLTIRFANRTFCDRFSAAARWRAMLVAPFNRQKTGSVMASSKRLVEERW